MAVTQRPLPEGCRHGPAERHCGFPSVRRDLKKDKQMARRHGFLHQPFRHLAD